MATLTELNGFLDGSLDDFGLKGKIKAALVIRAAAVFSEATPSQGRRDWAKATLADPTSAVKLLFSGLLGAKNTFTVVQIQGATDTTIKDRVNSAIDALYP